MKPNIALLYYKLSSFVRMSGLFMLFLFLLTLNQKKNVYAAGASLKFDPSVIETTVNSESSVNIIIDTSGESVGGAGAKIKYNPQEIQIIKIVTGTSFSDYPNASFDNSIGRMIISGIAGSDNQLFNGKGIFAQITFKILVNKQSLISFIFTPGITTDSNIAVTYGNGDILSEVGNLTIKINYNSDSTSPESSDISPTITSVTGSVIANDENKNPGFIRRFINSVGNILGTKKQEVDPHAPLQKLPPKTVLNQKQTPVPADSFNTDYSQREKVLFVVAILNTISLVVVIFMIVKKLHKK
jgi:hypothetical protein